MTYVLLGAPECVTLESAISELPAPRYEADQHHDKRDDQQDMD
jgi:hypothetical protein